MASMEYKRDEQGQVRTQVNPPRRVESPPKPPWEPHLGEDIRDKRDPEAVGKAHLRNVKRRKK